MTLDGWKDIGNWVYWKHTYQSIINYSAIAKLVRIITVLLPLYALHVTSNSTSPLSLLGSCCRTLVTLLRFVRNSKR
jgi:hypothetical protein